MLIVATLFKNDEVLLSNTNKVFRINNIAYTDTDEEGHLSGYIEFVLINTFDRIDQSTRGLINFKVELIT